VRSGVAGRGGRPLSGALCPTLNLAPGAYVDIIGGAPRRVPVWETAISPISRARRPLLVCISLSSCGGHYDATHPVNRRITAELGRRGWRVRRKRVNKDIEICRYKTMLPKVAKTPRHGGALRGLLLFDPVFVMRPRLPCTPRGSRVLFFSRSASLFI